MRALPVALALISLGCGGPDPVAFENRTFYDLERGGSGVADTGAESPYPPLDLAERNFIGVTAAANLARISRPKDWTVRRSSVVPGTRAIEYVSPRQFLFVLTERRDGPEELWLDILTRYEDETRAAGGDLAGMRVPMATANAQGRGYLVKRNVRAAVAPFVNTSREIVLRGESRVVLVQIVFGTGSLGALSDELLRVIATMEVL